MSDIEDVRRRAGQHIADGAVTDGYKADRARVVQILEKEEEHAEDLVFLLGRLADAGSSGLS